MVSGRGSLGHFRLLVPLLGLLALALLFFKLPGTSLLYGCTSCGALSPYLSSSSPLWSVLWGAGYFSLLTALSLLFPTFPGKFMGRPFAISGLVASLLLALWMSYQAWPMLCILCVAVHGCHLLIWGVWVFIPSLDRPVSHATLGTRLCLALFAPLSVVALFASLNLTFIAYRVVPEVTEVGLKRGDPIPAFLVKTLSGKEVTSRDPDPLLLNFVSPECSYCEEQLQLLQHMPNARIVNITPVLSAKLVQLLPDAEWVEDSERVLGEHFRVGGYPTLYKIKKGRVSRVIHGVSDTLLEDLES